MVAEIWASVISSFVDQLVALTYFCDEFVHLVRAVKGSVTERTRRVAPSLELGLVLLVHVLRTLQVPQGAAYNEKELCMYVCISFI